MDSDTIQALAAQPNPEAELQPSFQYSAKPSNQNGASQCHGPKPGTSPVSIFDGHWSRSSPDANTTSSSSHAAGQHNQRPDACSRGPTSAAVPGLAPESNQVQSGAPEVDDTNDARPSSNPDVARPPTDSHRTATAAATTANINWIIRSRINLTNVSTRATSLFESGK